LKLLGIDPVTVARRTLAKVDAWQRRTPAAAVVYGIVKKFGDDRLNQYVVALGWYGFLAIYPLLLVVVTVFGFIGVSSLGNGIVSTLHQFPVVGSQFTPEHGSQQLHGSIIGLVIGLLGLTYGAQGVMQTAQGAMAQAWNVSPLELPGFIPRLGRSMVGLLIIGGTFIINAGLASLATGSDRTTVIRILILLAMLILNVIGFSASFRALTPSVVRTRALLPGAVVGALGFTILITVGSGLIQHQLRHSSATYGQFGAVIGLVGFLLLLAKITLYGAETNPVLEGGLWPRSLVASDPSGADDQVLYDIAHQARRREDEAIGVGFGEHPVQDAAADAAATRRVPEKT
jgi:uncharacterized BrkB/YihY/UPF0761 family membrane protein